MIIGLTGKMGAGKSTVLELIKSHVGSVRLVKFAQPIYDIQEFVYNRIARVYKPDSSFIKDRFLLQFIGTDWGRNRIKETLWLDLWKEDTLQYSGKGCLVISDDIRFDNEALAVKEQKGIVVRVECDNLNNRTVAGAALTSHASEQGVSDACVDYVIKNNGTLEDLEREVLKMLDKYPLLKLR